MTQENLDPKFLAQVREIVTDPSFLEHEESLIHSSPKFANLDPNIRRAALALFYMNEQDLVSDLWHIFYTRPIPKIEDFISREYMGDFADNIYPKWIDVAHEVFHPNSRIYETIIGGGIGIGKTTVGIQLLQFYNLYRMTSLRYPQLAHPDVAPNTMMVLMLFSLSLSKAAMALKKPMMDMLERSPKFIQINKRQSLYKNYGDDVVPYQDHGDLILFPRNISIMIGSRVDHD